MAALLSESFETDGNGTRYTTSIPEFTNGDADFFTRTDGSNISSDYNVTGPDGSFYFAAQDIDGPAGFTSPQSLEFTGIDISDANNLVFSLLVAEDQATDGNKDWDASDFFTVEYQIDGGGYFDVLAFENSGPTFNTAPFEDTDFDAVGDGTEVTSTFATFENPIVGTGSSLDLRITFGLNSGDEDLAIDLLEVNGDIVPSGPTKIAGALDSQNGGANSNLASFVASPDLSGNNGAFASSNNDVFGLTDRSINFDFADDSAGSFPADTFGIIKTGDTAPFLGVEDVDNGDNPNVTFGTASWTFDISGATSLTDVMVDLAAMGDFETSDTFEITGAVDGGAPVALFSITADDSTSYTYILESGASRTENDPLVVGGTTITNDFATFTSGALNGLSGNNLEIILTATQNAGSEVFAMRDIMVLGNAGPPTPGVSVSGGPAISEDGTTGTVTLSLDTTPTAQVDLTITSDSQSEVSLDGVTFSNTVTVNLDGATLTDDVIVRAIDDTDVEGAHVSSLSVTTSSADGNYDVLVIPDITANIADNDTPFFGIHDVQGSGGVSPQDGNRVTIEGVVTYIEANGFYLQEEDDETDADPLTSEGIFVFTGSAPTVAIGDLLTATGDVQEFNGETQLTNADLSVDASMQVLPGIVDISLPGMTQAALEAYEGMRIKLTSSTDPLVVIENFNMDRFGEITVAEGNQTQATQIFDPATEQTQIQALIAQNANERLLLDDNNSAQNPTSFPYADSTSDALDSTDTFTATGPTVRLGAELLDDPEGVLSYSFGEYRLMLDNTIRLNAATNEGARAQTSPSVGGDLKVSSFNVLNYFNTLDIGSAGSGPNMLNPRGADSASELTRQTDKLVAAMLEIEADIFALQEIENSDFGAGGTAVADLVTALNTEATTMGLSVTYDFVDPTGGAGYVGTDAISAGLIYNTAKVTAVSSDFLVFSEPSSTDTETNTGGVVSDLQRNRPAVAAQFEETATGERLVVVSNHFKSKGDSGLDAFAGTPGLDPNIDQGDGQGYWNAVRTDGANELATWLATDPLSTGGDPDILILGDLNAYAKEDPVVALETAGYTDLTETAAFIGSEAYSFVFDGQRGTLDYGLASSSLLDNVTGVAEWHIAADEPDLLNYDESFKDPAFYSVDPFASSDHDPLIIGLTLDEQGIIGVYSDDTFTTELSSHNLMADALAAAQDDEAIDVLDDAAVGDFGAQIATSDGLTVRGDDPVDGTITTGRGVRDLVLAGTTNADVMGNGLANTLTGSDGANTINGKSGNDTIDGGTDDDILLGGNGADVLLGNVGADDLSGQGAADMLDGGDNNDTLKGGADEDTLLGGAGDDSLLGQAARDTLNGGADNDVLNGGKANDVLRGGTGDDTLLGATGNDNLYGGAGLDIFQFRAGHGTLDQIFDFEDGTDLIEFNINSVSNFADLTLTNVFTGVDIDYGTGNIRVLGLSDADFSGADFTFL